MKKLIVLLILLLVIGCGQKNEENVVDKEKEVEQTSNTIGSLPIGSLVMDQSWEWETRAEPGYTGDGLKKPVVWIVVAKDHYDVDEDVSHVTLLSKEILGRYTFDDSTDRGSDYGSNHWGDSGTTNATRGIRPFIKDVFAKEFSVGFNNSLLTTNVKSVEALTGDFYTTKDKVFLPCRSEIDRDQRFYTPAGEILPYFDIDNVAEGFERRKAQLPGLSATDPDFADFDDYWNYLTRTPADGEVSFIYRVVLDGNYSVGNSGDTSGFWGIRPLVNINSNTIIAEEPNADGIYLLQH